MKRLFFTGPIGCGKSTAIEAALGQRLRRCGGFRTRRFREPHLHFALERPDGSETAVFLDFPGGKPRVNLDAFSRVELNAAVLVLDEIGGIELLNPQFQNNLYAALDSGVPILGVLKGEAPAGAMIRALGLTEEYTRAAAALSRHLRSDPDTVIYECSQFDENARRLAALWGEQHLHDELF